ncbi:hypothetical protein QP027_10500 [Corynebacterium breve]|uniref:Uncharacterized protein n=1 Tax=Corynebacterium breve TaxID=3049799 RepID=A0ABY8VCX8_9CORY|nr:hypothetical protein [Corynebacterium breve]WIM67515.1 hypothetical protein QP027_10500 [Corynebacterium breve]
MSITSIVNLFTGNTARKHADAGMNSHQIQEAQRREAERLKAWSQMAASLHRN